MRYAWPSLSIKKTYFISISVCSSWKGFIKKCPWIRIILPIGHHVFCKHWKANKVCDKVWKKICLVILVLHTISLMLAPPSQNATKMKERTSSVFANVRQFSSCHTLSSHSSMSFFVYKPYSTLGERTQWFQILNYFIVLRVFSSIQIAF